MTLGYEKEGAHSLTSLRPDTIFEKREKRFLRKWAPFFLLGAFFQDQHCIPRRQESRIGSPVGAMSGASHRLEQSSRAYNYGFDVSKLYEREEKGRKDWRAEVVPTDDEKDRAKAAVVSFKAEFPLGGGTLDGIFEAHRAHVSRLLEHGPRHQRAWYAQRLEMARVPFRFLFSLFSNIVWGLNINHTTCT